MTQLTKKAYKEKEKRNEAKKNQTELDLPKIPKLSEELIKELHKYKLQKECGLRIEAKYINGVKFPLSEAEELENYFKYIVLGKLPSDNNAPKGKLLKNGNLSIDYQRIESQKVNLTYIMNRLNYEIEHKSFLFTNPKYTGVADIIALDKNIKTKDPYKNRIIIDIQRSSYLNDKLNPLGWDDESIANKWDILIRAIHYKILAKYEWGINDIPFYFIVFNTKNDWEYKIFKIEVNDATKSQHFINLNSAKNFLDETLSHGWIAYPNYKVCKDCPLGITCNNSVDMVKIKEVYI